MHYSFSFILQCGLILKFVHMFFFLNDAKFYSKKLLLVVPVHLKVELVLYICHNMDFCTYKFSSM